MSPTNAFVTGAHGLTLVHSIYYKGFLLNSIRCLLKSNLNVLAMENIPEITPHKKKKKIDLNLCMICQKCFLSTSIFQKQENQYVYVLPQYRNEQIFSV